MAWRSSIEWTDATWNPVTGCDKVSAGCRHCYAERFARRLQAMGNPRYVNGTAVTLHWDLLKQPLAWRAPRLVFVNSMSDLFHEEVPAAFVEQVFEVAAAADRHTFQILTKRPKRLLELAPKLPWPPNVWVGVSVESRDYVWRIDTLRTVPAAVRFLSMEPLRGPVNDLNLEDIHWVIVGGESGPGARPMRPEWVRRIREECRAQRVAFFFKQWGGPNKKAAGRMLDGRTWDEMPAPSSHASGWRTSAG